MGGWAALSIYMGIMVVDSFYFIFYLFYFLLFKEMILVCVADSFGPFARLVK